MQGGFEQSVASTHCDHHYFQSKEEIIEAIADERHAREREARARESVADAMTQLRTAFFSPLKEPERRRQLRMGVQLWAETLRNPRILKIIRRGFSEPHGLLTKLNRERARLRGNLEGAGAAFPGVAGFGASGESHRKAAIITSRFVASFHEGSDA